MATPHSYSNSNDPLSTGPSRTLLQQLLEEINGASPTRVSHNESPPGSPASTGSRSSSQNHSPSVWVGGSTIAQEARDKLRTADEAHRRKLAVGSVDCAPESVGPKLYLDTERLDTQDPVLRDKHGIGSFSELRQSPDPVGCPHEYMQYILNGSPLSPGVQGGDSEPLYPQATPPGFTMPPILSPLIFSDVYSDDSSSLSPQTETTVSPTDAPTSAATVYTAEELRTPTDNDAHKKSQLFNESLVEPSVQKKRTMTVPELRSNGYFEMAVGALHEYIDVGGDNRCLLRHETFTERKPTPRMLTGLPTTGTLPEPSSFRPTAAEPQGQPSFGGSTQKISRSFTSPAQPASPAMPGTPAWMRAMHLVDTGGKCIYMNVHDDGPIRHALCLWCFRTQGSFHKVRKHGYESCGRREVLDSHYWEDDKCLEDSWDVLSDSDH